MIGIYTDIAFKGLQNEPRYQALIQKMKFSK